MKLRAVLDEFENMYHLLKRFTIATFRKINTYMRPLKFILIITQL